MDFVNRWLSRLGRFLRPKKEVISIVEQVDAVAVNAQATWLLVKEILANHRAERRWKLVRRSIYALSMLVGIAVTVRYSFPQAFDMPGAGDKVAIISIKGNILSGAPASAEQVVPALRKAFERKDVRGIILRIDSGGGAPSESERINAAILELKARFPEKKVTAVIETLGASAAYMIALQADSIYAGRYSLVGSIGAVLMNWDVSRALERFDVRRRVFASGELKAALDPFVASTPKADAWAKSMVDQIGVMFTEEVKAKRGSKLKDGVVYSTGEVWNGTQAKEVGLIDVVGTEDNAIAAMGGGKKLEPEYFGPDQRRTGLFTIFSDAVGSATRAVLQALETEPGRLE
jgi:protease IV